MSAKALYIIGNGFDLHHGLATRFSDFREFVAGRHPDLQSIMEEYLCELSGDWANLEEALANFDVDQLLDHALNFLESYGTEKWKDSYHHNYQHEINVVVQAISRQLKSEFSTWVQQVQIPPKGTCQRLIIDPSAYFLNFNYTRTIQEIYSVNQSNILHIHGSADNEEGGIILGHGWEASQRPNYTNYGNPEDIDTRVMEGYKMIESYFDETFKPTKEILTRNQNYFASLSSVSDIYVWGHSLSEVDLPYIAKIASTTIPSSPVWHVSHHSSSNIERNSTAMASIGVQESSIHHHQLKDYAI